MGRPLDHVDAPQPKSLIDYIIWALCSFATLAGLGFIGYGRPRVNFWQECVRAATGRDSWESVAGTGLVLLAASGVFGWVLHVGIVGRFGRLTDRPPGLVADYDDDPPTPPAG
jgi:hypothetical protein